MLRINYQKMKNGLLIVIALIYLTNCSDNKTIVIDTVIPKDSLETINYFDFKFATVRAFATVSAFDYSNIYFDKTADFSKFHDTISRSLDSKQVEYLRELLSGKFDKDTATIITVADCFYPRHNIIFLNDKDSIINYISVCFECNQVKASKYARASMDNYSDFFNSIGLKVFLRPDYYEAYYDSLNKLKTKKIM